MAIKCNVVTASSSLSITKDQRVTICGSDSITLTLPIFENVNITENTRFVVIVPAGSGYTSIEMQTIDGTSFDANGSSSYILPSEGQYEFCINNGRWYILPYEFPVQQFPASLLSSSITWVGTTAPSGTTNHEYGGIYSGCMFFGWIVLSYSIAGVGISSVTITLPTDWPQPISNSGIIGASRIMYPGTHIWTTSDTLINSGSANRACIRRNSSDTGWTIFSTQASTPVLNILIQINYPVA
jgi:hypothetical protein